MKEYRHIFFDLDHTLWDFDTNSVIALQTIYEQEGLQNKGVADFSHFHKTYKSINDRYWARYHHAEVSKEQLRIGRFSDTLEVYGIHDTDLSERMADAYIQISPHMTALFDGAIDLLKYLQEKYSLHIITNGFAEVQWIKLEKSGLRPFFEHIIISEEVGTQKPDKEIFEVALSKAGTKADECIMIGDNYMTDIVGAKAAGLDQIYFNPLRRKRNGPVTYEVHELGRIKEIL